MTIEETRCLALLDTGATVSMITPAFVTAHNLQVGPLSNLGLGTRTKLKGIGGIRTDITGYVVMRVRVEGVAGYDEDQVALVTPDSTEFGKRVPIILGTPTIDRVLQVVKEGEIDKLATPWASTRMSHLLRARMGVVEEDGGDKTETPGVGSQPLDYDELLRTKEDVTMLPFTANIVHCRSHTASLMGRLHVMVAAMRPSDGCLPNGLQVQATYTDIKMGSKSVVVVIRNVSSKAILLPSKTLVARVCAANAIPDSLVRPGTLEELDRELGVARPSLTAKERLAHLWEKLDITGLASWPKEHSAEARALLAKFQDIFSLESNELGCLADTEHRINITDDAPFKERFRRIPPPWLKKCVNTSRICRMPGL